MSSSEKTKATVAVIILNYNSWQDTVECVSLCLRQSYSDFLVIVVDNASSDGSVDKLKAEWASASAIKCLVEYDKEQAEAGGTEEKETELQKNGAEEKLVLITIDKNLGYSAGNNVGIRYALNEGAEAVLIVNPDVVAEDKDVIAKMAGVLFSRGNYYVVGPRVYDRVGHDQNPLYEPSFVEEVFGTFWKGLLASLGKERRGCLDLTARPGPRVVEKVSGCCVMIKCSFLRDRGLLDENVFLYSEEPILAHRVRQAGGSIIYAPEVSVRHLHRGDPGDIAKYRRFIRSRIYFLREYRKYGLLKLLMVRASYEVVLLVKLLRVGWKIAICRA